MLRSEWGRFSAEYGFGDSWGGFGGTGDDWAGGGGVSGMSPETALGMADYERRLQNTRDANAAQSAINRGDTGRAAAILSANPEVGIETGGQRLMGGQAANYLTSQMAQTAADADRRLAPQPPDLSSRGMPPLTMPLGAPSGQLPLEAASAPALPPPPPSSTGGMNVAAQQGIDRAAQLRSQVTAQGASLTPNARANGENSPSTSAPPLPPLSAETLREFNGGSIIVPVHATDTPQTVARRQLEMTVAAVGQQGRLTAEDQRAFVEEWSQTGLGLYNYETDGTRREFTAEEFRQAQTAGSTFLQLHAAWQPGIVADLRRLLELSEPVRVETSERRMTREEQRVAGRREAEQQLVDFYRMQANAGIGLLNGTLQLLSMQPNLTARTEDGTEVPIGGQSPQLPYLELQSEYFRGGRGQVAQAAATVGAGLIAAGGMPRAGAPSITAEVQAARSAVMTSQAERGVVTASSESVSALGGINTPISNRTQSILSRFSEARRINVEIPNGATVRIEVVENLTRGNVRVNDLGRLQAATGHEYTLLRGLNGQRVLIRGEHNRVAIPERFLSGEFRWSGHSQPFSTRPSPEDRQMLRFFGQESSVIMGARGGWERFQQVEDLSNWLP